MSRGWANSDFRGLTGPQSFIGPYTGDFVLSAELDPDQLLQADDLMEFERDATPGDNISYVFFSWDGVGEPCAGGTCVSNVNVIYTFDPVCGI